MRVRQLPDAWVTAVRDRGDDPERPTLQVAWDVFKELATVELKDKHADDRLEVSISPSPDGPRTWVGLTRHVVLPRRDYESMFAFNVELVFKPIDELKRFGRFGINFEAEEDARSGSGFVGPGATDKLFAAVEGSDPFRALLATGQSLQVRVHSGSEE